MEFKHLGLKEWPFNIVPNNENIKIWAGRESVYNDVLRLISEMSRRPTSTINLLWAWYGCGKSHLLKHIDYLCDHDKYSVHSVYTVFPHKPKGFIDIYTAFLNNIDESVLTSCALASLAFNMYSANFTAAMKAISHGTYSQKDIALRWLRTEKVDLREIRSIGIQRRIDDSNYTVAIFKELIELIRQGTGKTRVLWMIDEYQRIAESKENIFTDINCGLHNLFNDNPTGLSMLLSFSITVQSNMYNLITRELEDRAKMQKVLTLPLMGKAEATDFIKDLITNYRVEDYSTNEYHPFNEASINAIIEFIQECEQLDLKPRTIIQCCDVVLGEIDYLYSSKQEIAALNPIDVRNILAERVNEIADEG